MLFTGLGRSVLGKTVPSVSSTARGRRLRSFLEFLFFLIIGYYLYIETSTGLIGNKAVLISPQFQQAYSTCQLKFSYHMYGSTIGRSMASKRYAKATDPRVEGYDPTQPTNHITYLDANNLYGWAMSLPLPKKNFHRKRVMPTEEQMMKMKHNSKKGWILEVDFEYPAHLHDTHNDYPLAPEKKAIKPEQMSEYQRRLMTDLNLTMPNTEKLVLTLEDKEKYVTHYSNLQFYLRQGMRLKKVHRVIEFDQEPWMEPYIRMNTEFRKQAKSDFETEFYKLMNNSVFGKTMENLRNRVDVKIVRD